MSAAGGQGVIAPVGAVQDSLELIEHLLDRQAAPIRHAEHRAMPAMRAVASRLAVAPPADAHARPDEPLETVLIRLCDHANLTVRAVAIDDGYVDAGLGPAIVERASTGDVLALVRRGAGWSVTGASGLAAPLDDALLDDLAPRAWQINRGLPLTEVRTWDLFSFGWRDVLADLAGYALLTAVAGLILAAVPLLSGTVVSIIAPGHELGLLRDIALMLLVLLAANFGVQLATKLAMVRIDGKLGSILRTAAIARLIAMPPGEADRIAPPVMALALRALEGWHRTTWKIALGLVASVLMAAPSLVVMASSAPMAALAVLATLGLFLAAGVWIVGRQQRAIFATMTGSPASWMAVAYEAFANIETVRAMGAEMTFFRRWTESFLSLKARMLRSSRIGAEAAGLSAALEAAVLLVAVTGIIIGGATLQSATSIPFLMAALAVAGAGGAMMSAVGEMAMLGVQQRLAAPLLQVIPPPLRITAELPEPTGTVRLAALTYRYGPDLAPVLDDVDLVIAPGDYIGITGPSGAGKSTLLKLILGMLAPDSGAVLIDGIDTRKVDMRLLRRRIGVVGQGARLFPGSLRENVSMGRAMTDDEIWDVLERSAMKADVAAMPLRLDTIVGDTNAMFSGGQVQRLLFARAIASRPKLIILDEATSALDPVAQSIITHTIRELKVTVIAVAHRTETLRDCDRIYRVEGGAVTLVSGAAPAA